MYTTEEKMDLADKAEKLITTLPEVVRDSLGNFVDKILYRGWAETDYRYGLGCYIAGLADAGLISFKDSHMLCEYFDETLK